jgi:hypothetical protein
VDNIKMDLREIEWGGIEWIERTGLGSVEGICEYGNEPSGSIESWEVLECLYNWRLLKMGSAP